MWARVWKREIFYTIGGNVDWSNHLETVCRFPKKLKIEVPYDPAVPLLGTYPKEMKSPSCKDI
uniref:Uncharacterized protein n=1 Tax=Sciurus vulgaris TaxID=55149 RepID=A0A8D2DWN6_SCIVU